MRRRDMTPQAAELHGLFAFLSRVQARASAVVEALSLHTSPGNDHCDPGKEVYGLPVVAFLRGHTPAAKVALPVLYALVGTSMGPLKAGTWGSIATLTSLLHILLPYAHHHLYVRPLQEARQAAVQPGLALSSSFQLLDPGSLRQYQQFVRKSTGPGYVVSAGRMLGVLSVAAARSMQAAGAAIKIWGVPWRWLVLPSLLLVGLVYFPARLHTLVRQQHRWSGQLDGAILVLGHCVSPLPLAGAWLSGADSCGLPEAYLSVGSAGALVLLGLAIIPPSMVLLSALLDGPIGLMAAVTAAVTVLNAVAISFGSWCIKQEKGITVPPVAPVLVIGAWLAGSIACVAVKVHQEKSRLLRYTQQLAAKRPAEPLESRAFYEGDSHLLVAVKMGDVTPASLPFNLRDRILSTVQVLPESFTGSIWPGCVLLGIEMRFQSGADMRAAWMSFLSHNNWNNTLLDSIPSAIDMGIQGSAYVVRGGQLKTRLLCTHCPCIASVEPLAPSPLCTTLTLQLLRLGDESFKVMLRCGGHFHELEVAERSPADSSGRSIVVVRLPEAAQLDGLGWVEVMLEAADGSFAMSEASPMLFTSVPEVAKELSTVLPDFCPDDSQAAIAGMLGDLARCLQGEAAAPPRLLLHLAKLGMTECFANVATSAAALRAADREGQGLLGSAVMSSSVQMVDLVVSTLDAFHLPVNPCQRAPDARGYTALHWAADAGDLDLVYTLLAEASNPLESWRGCRARLCGKTPAQLMAEAGRGAAFDEKMLKDNEEDEDDQGQYPEEAAAAVWGADVAAALGEHPVVTHMSFLALYAALCVQLGLQDPLAWWTVIATFVSLHILVPYAYKEVYMKGLAEVRGLAAEQGLAVSWAFRFLASPLQQGMYEQFAAERASAQLLWRSACTAAIVLSITATTTRLFEHWGAWRHAPMLFGCSVLVSLQAFAILTKRLRLWRWLEPVVVLYCFAQGGPPFVVWITGNPDICMTPSSMLSAARNGLFQLGLIIVVMGALSPFCLATIPKAPGAPLHLPSEVLIVLVVWMMTSPLGQRCIAAQTGMDTLGNLGNLFRVSHAILFRVVMFAVRLWAEKQNMCAFLTVTAMRRAEKVAADSTTGG